MESRNSNDPSYSVNSFGLPGISISNEYNILKDDFTLNDILYKKFVELKALHRELNNASQEISFEDTSLNFATFVKDKKDFITVLYNILDQEEPNSYPKYRVEAYMKFKDKLENELSGLKMLMERIKADKEETETKIERIERQILEVHNDSTDENTHQFDDMVCLKISELKFEEAQKNLNNVVHILFPNEAELLMNILCELEKAKLENDVKKRWVNVTDDMELAVEKLVQLSIIKINPLDNKKISLI